MWTRRHSLRQNRRRLIFPWKIRRRSRSRRTHGFFFHDIDDRVGNLFSTSTHAHSRHSHGFQNLAATVDDAFAEKIEDGFFARRETAPDGGRSGDRRRQHGHGARFKGREDVFVGGFEASTRQSVGHAQMRNGGGTRRRETRVEAETRIDGTTRRLRVGDARQAAQEAELAARTATATEATAPVVGEGPLTAARGRTRRSAARRTERGHDGGGGSQEDLNGGQPRQSVGTTTVTTGMGKRKRDFGWQMIKTFNKLTIDIHWHVQIVNEL